MRTFLATLVAIWGICVLTACETAGSEYDGVSRFAGSDGLFYGPSGPPREPPPSDFPVPTEQRGNI